MKKLLLVLSLILFSVSSFSQISKITKKVVYVRDQGVCQCCGNHESLEYDYKKPYSCGGSSEIDNIQLLCRKCNRSKSNSSYCKIHNKKVGEACSKGDASSPIITASQCYGTTQKGNRCKNRTNNGKYCFFHVPYNEYLPESNGDLVNHTYYSLSYSEQHEQAEWVIYEIEEGRILGIASRTNDFRIDEMISTNSATLSDYAGYGYDRGHLVPAADMSFSNTAMSESFLMSNISPQHPSFNRGVWKELEKLVRSWGNNSSVHVVTGPILNDCNSTIGINNVCVPEFFYKVIYEPREKKMIAFVLPNKNTTKMLKSYVCTIDSLEKITNIDFFPNLPNKLEKRLESKKDTSKWIWYENR